MFFICKINFVAGLHENNKLLISKNLISSRINYVTIAHQAHLIRRNDISNRRSRIDTEIKIPY